MKERRPSYDEIKARLDRAEALIEAFKKQQVDETCDKEQVVKLKETEEALRVSEQKYRLIADNAADMIWTMDWDVRFTFMSPSCFPMIGVTPEEMIEKEPIEFLPDDSYKILTKTLREELAIEASGAEKPSRTRIVELELLCKMAPMPGPSLCCRSSAIPVANP